MATVAKQDTAKKAERKKPVRKAPVQKDYPSKLEWLAALVEYETKQTEAGNAHRVERLDKRIAAKKATRDKVVAEITELVKQRDALVGDDVTDVEDEDGLTEADHLVLEGKA